MLEILSGVFAFTGVITLLTGVILLARRVMVPEGNVHIEVNGDTANLIETGTGSKLLNALADEGMFLSSACGGGGTCGQCRCQVVEGGGDILPTETAHFALREIKDHWRLACQVPVKRDLKIKVPEEVFGIKHWDCVVESNNNVATLIKELVLKLPPGEEVNFRAGGFVQLEAPSFQQKFADMDVGEFSSDWKQMGLLNDVANSEEQIVRAYSMANYPEEKGVLKFNIRVEVHPPARKIPPGKMSSYVFGLKPGDHLQVFGPYGDFFAKDTDTEMIFVGGGAGMAPMRSHIFDQLKRVHSKRKISFWYGARSQKEMFYMDDFDQLAKDNDNFDWHVALSDALPEDNWTGMKGFIHQVLLDEYLSKHDAPEDCEYYLCGPPPMLAAVRAMLDSLGVPEENVLFDDFGS